MLFLLKENFLDQVNVKQVSSFATQFVSYVRSVYQEVYDTILVEQDFSDKVRKKLLDIATEFSTLFVPPENKK